MYKVKTYNLYYEIRISRPLCVTLCNVICNNHLTKIEHCLIQGRLCIIMFYKSYMVYASCMIWRFLIISPETEFITCKTLNVDPDLKWHDC